MRHEIVRVTASFLHRPASTRGRLTDPLPVAVERLLGALGDVDTLELLLALARSPLRYWSSSQLARTVPSPDRRRASLEKLAQLNLADVRLGEDLLYRYAPATRGLEQTVTKLTWEYDLR